MLPCRGLLPAAPEALLACFRRRLPVPAQAGPGRKASQRVQWEVLGKGHAGAPGLGGGRRVRCAGGACCHRRALP